MRDPYSPPEAVIRDPTPKQSVLVAVLLGVPTFLYLLHALAILAVIVWGYWDGFWLRGAAMWEVMSRPMVVLQPLCSLSAALLLFFRRRIALVPAVALPIVIVVYAEYYAIRLSMSYVTLTSSVALWVAALAFFRKLR